jgi:multiple sugar transport system ATP-binding protein
MGFALKLRGEDKAEINKKVEEAARILDLTPHLDRKPSQLSGGQRQRVAMGRAVVRNPQAFLMDEPLSNLDAKLRVQMRTEVSRIQQTLGTTTIYVTHDQTEAMTLGDRVAVMRSGVVQQVGSPMDLYNEPANLFVAGFIGSPAMNFMPARVEGDTLKLPLGDISIPQQMLEKTGRLESGRSLIAGIRPEEFEEAHVAEAEGKHGTTFKAKIEVLEAMGSEYYAHFTASTDQSIDSAELRELAEDSGAGDVPTSGEQGRIVARLNADAKVRQGDEADLYLDASSLHLFDPEDGRSLTSSYTAPSATNGGQGPGGRDPNERSDAAA